MEKFLEELREALEQVKGVDVDSVIDKYLEHFSLGHEAGMTDEEIIERFDSIEDIISSLNQTEKNSDEQEESGRSIILDIAIFSDFTIETLDKPFGIQFKLDEEATKYVEIIKNEKEIHLKSKEKNILRKSKKFEGTLFIGNQEKIDKFSVTAVNCDIEFNCKLDCRCFSITTISGDVSDLDVTASEKIYINSVNGDFEMGRLMTQTCQISTVNGDMTIEELVCDQAKISTVHGDIRIKNSNEAPYSISTVAGDVVIDSGVKPEDVKVSTVSGNVTIEGESVGKSLGEMLRSSFKF